MFSQDEFSGVITKALSTLVLGLETRLENELANMARLPWATLESVGDQSEYALNHLDFSFIYLLSRSDFL